MATRETKNISFTPQQSRFIEERVTSGSYQSASEVVRDAMRLLEQQEREREAAIDEVRRLVQEGTEQLDRGETLDGPAVMEELRERLLRKANGSAKDI